MTVIDLLPEADKDAEKAVYDALRAYNIDRFGPSGYKALHIVLRDDEGKVVGGLMGETARGWLFIKLLFVPKEQRGKGLATRMLQMAENEARARECVGMQIDTMSPEALTLYLRYGFMIAGRIEGLAGGHDLIWLTRRIDD